MTNKNLECFSYDGTHQDSGKRLDVLIVILCT